MPSSSVTPTIPPEAVLAQSAVSVPHTGDTNEAILATIAVPANAIGKNGRVQISVHYSMTSSANTKFVKVRYGASGSGVLGTTVCGNSFTTVAQAAASFGLANRNATNAQVSSIGVLGAFSTGNALTTAAIDTTAATEINITGQLALSSETITLEAYQVLLYYAP